MGTGRVFWTLFQHIKANKIPMTAPVEMEYRGVTKSSGFFGESINYDGQKMGFVYKVPEYGPVGQTPSGVIVEDKPEITVLAIGLRGKSTNPMDVYT